jgi:hypothetical protein
MSTGFNVLICGSSDITYDHIEAHKKIKNIKVGAIFSRNIEKVKQISNKFSLKVLKNLGEEQLKDYDIAVITSSTTNHIKYIETLSLYIKKIIVEKPIILNSAQFKILKKIKKENNIFIKEVSLFSFKPKNLFFDSFKIDIKKKRNLYDFKNFKNEVDVCKSPILNHLPHWYDFASLLLGNNMKLIEFSFDKFDDSLNFHKKIYLDISNGQKKIKIDIDLTHHKNCKNKLKFNPKNKLINLLSFPINFFLNKTNFVPFINTKNKIPLLEKFYNTFLKELNYNSQDEYIDKLENKILFIDKIWQLSKK